MNTNDIRYIKTHNNINDAVVSLLRQKKFDKIYVKDICDTAKISRGTFYLHYVDKYDLVNQNLQQFITLSTQLINNPKVRTIENLMLLTLNRLKTDGQIAALLLSKNGSP
ncbi:TetR/AcrR family transcriptional regulator [Holzapfeliella sp. JNUCC 72]